MPRSFGTLETLLRGVYSSRNLINRGEGPGVELRHGDELDT